MAGPLLDFRRVVPSLLARMPDVTEARVVSRPTLKSADGLDTPNCPPLQHWLRGYVSLAYSLHNEKPSGTESLTARPRLWLGADLSNHNHVTGGIGEAIVYPAAHSGTERKAIEEVLMQRWRIKPRAAMADPSARPQAAGNTVFFRGQVFFGGHLVVFRGPDARRWFAYRGENRPQNRELLCIDPFDLDEEGHVRCCPPSLGRMTVPVTASPSQ